jgi:deoxyribodipyrimidine photo-lyase
MLCASVLTKYFWIDWRDGARFYYQHLVDADPFSNTAGWGFASSTGADAVPYFRAPFNPFIQSKRFDAEATYIKKWVPELADVPAKAIHAWNDAKVRANVEAKVPNTGYPAPIVDAKVASAAAIAAFKAAAAKAREQA